jgi:hypothetical protein
MCCFQHARIQLQNHIWEPVIGKAKLDNLGLGQILTRSVNFYLLTDWRMVLLLLLLLLLLVLVVAVLGPWASFGRNQSPVRRPVWLWHATFWAQVLSKSLPLLSPAFRCSHFHHQRPPRPQQCEWGGTVGENRGNLAEMMPLYAIYESFTCCKSTTRDWWLYFPSEGRHAEDFFARKIRRLRPGLNPRTWVPEASMLTTRPPKPLTYGLWIF